MEVINPNLIPITAYETYQLIKEIKANSEKEIEEEVEELTRQQGGEGNERNLQQETIALRHHLIPENLKELVQNCLNYFESTTDPAYHPPQSKLSPHSISNLCQALRNQFGQVTGNPNGLSKAERLQICDLAPTELVEIYLIIEECDSRFTETEVESIINLVKENLSNAPLIGSTTTTGGANDANGGINGDVKGRAEDDPDVNMEEDDINLGDVDDDDALVAEAREGGPAPDRELDEVPD